MINQDQCGRKMLEFHWWLMFVFRKEDGEVIWIETFPTKKRGEDWWKRCKYFNKDRIGMRLALASHRETLEEDSDMPKEPQESKGFPVCVRGL